MFDGNEGDLGANSCKFQLGYDFDETPIMPPQQNMTLHCNDSSQAFMSFHPIMLCPTEIPSNLDPIRPPMSGGQEGVVASPPGN